MGLLYLSGGSEDLVELVDGGGGGGAGLEFLLFTLPVLHPVIFLSENISGGLGGLGGRGGRGGSGATGDRDDGINGTYGKQNGSHMSKTTPAGTLNLLEEKEIERQEYQHLRKGSLEERIELNCLATYSFRTVRILAVIYSCRTKLKIDVARWDWRRPWLLHPTNAYKNALWEDVLG